MNPSMSYVQCYDRYVFLSYLLATSVCAGQRLPTDVAEAAAFFLTRRLLELADIQRQLDADLSSADAEALDAKYRWALPQTMAILQGDQCGALNFSRRWKIVWFADEHEMVDTWIIWDAIIAKSDSVAEFIDDLCVAHLSQVRPPKKEKGKMQPHFLEVISQYKAWKPHEIVNYAVKRFDARSRKIKFVKQYNIAAALLVALLFVWLFWGRFEKNE
jgi:hypothetical protein